MGDIWEQSSGASMAGSAWGMRVSRDVSEQDSEQTALELLPVKHIILLC